MRMTPANRVLHPSKELSTARYVLLNLPTEVIFHFCGIVLSNGDGPFESLDLIKKVLELVPEISWCLEIVTDEIPLYRSDLSFPQRLRILSLDDYEESLLFSSSANRSSVSRLVRRALVLFNSPDAVDTGELSLGLGCRYSTLLSSWSFDVSYCFITFRNTYADELLNSIRGRLPARRASSMHILMPPGTANDTPFGCCNSGTCKSLNPAELENRSNVLYYHAMCQKVAPNCVHLVIPDPCSTVKDNQICRTSTLQVPPAALLCKGLSRFYMAFKGTLIPMMNNIANSIEPLPDNNAGSLFSLANLNWSFTNPHGSIVCKHTSTNPIATDQECYEAIYGGVEPLAFTKAYKSIVYYGISDTSVMDMTVFGGALEEFVWYRLSPNVLVEARVVERHAYAPRLKRLVILSELRESRRDLSHIPCFEGMGVLDHVQLVALEDSDQCWEIDRVLRPKSSLATVKSLELLQLRKESVPFPYQRSKVRYISYIDIRSVAARLERLSIGGYLAMFVLPVPSMSTPSFDCLEFLSLDVSCVVTSDGLDHVDGIWYTFSLPERHFPSLKHLYLKGILGMAYLALFPRLVLTKTCTQITLSSVIRERFVVNDKELEIPVIPVVADTFNKWQWSSAAMEYIYRGTGFSQEKRFQEVAGVDLRPI